MGKIICNNQRLPYTPSATLHYPTDKSISQRALLLAAQTEGETLIHNLNKSTSVLVLVEALRKLGITIIEREEGVFSVSGSFRSPGAEVPVVNLGSSSAAARFLIGTMAGLGGSCVIDGDDGLRARPMDWVVDPLRALGAQIDYLGMDGRLPVRVRPSQLHGGKVTIAVGSAQASSAVLFAAFAARIDVEIVQHVLARDHTARLMNYLGANITLDKGSYKISAGRRSTDPYKYHRIPVDPSGIAYLFAAYFVQRRREKLVIDNVCLNPTRTGFFEILKRAGISLYEHSVRNESGEPVGTIEMQFSERLGPILMNDDFLFHAAIDEVPLVAALSLFAEGESRLLGAGELEFKETDRLKTTQLLLQDFGAQAELKKQGLYIRGGQKIKAGVVRSFGDHRIAMTAAVLGCSLAGDSEIMDGTCYTTSFPGFVNVMNGLGFNVRVGDYE